MNGNKRFVTCTAAQKDVCDPRRKELTNGQHPFAIVVSCSDSRVAPEIIFDEGLGELFVVRVAGNVLDPVALGSSAAMDAKGHAEGNIGTIVKMIQPAVKTAKAKGGSKEEMLKTAIRENVFLSYKTIRQKSPVLKHLIEKGDLKVIAGVYHLDSGEFEGISLQTDKPAVALGH